MQNFDEIKARCGGGPGRLSGYRHLKYHKKKVRFLTSRHAGKSRALPQTCSILFVAGLTIDLNDTNVAPTYPQRLFAAGAVYLQADEARSRF